MASVRLSMGVMNVCFVLILSMNSIVNSFPNEISTLDVKTCENEGTARCYEENKLCKDFGSGGYECDSCVSNFMEDSNGICTPSCKCLNGKCVKEGKRDVCVCNPEYGKYKPDECKACECGKGFNCSFEPGFFKTDKTCFCPGGQKLKNEKCKDFCVKEPCTNGGTCQNEIDNYRCICPAGYLGENCTTKNYCSEKPCQNGGICQNQKDTYKCICPKGFIGDKCTRDYCANKPCRNGGICQNLKDNYACICPDGYVGDNCDSRVIPKCDCKNGECRKDSLGNNRCVCLPEFGKYSEHECRACECGKGYNCTFDIGFFRDEKYCICPYGLEKNHPCKDLCANNPCRNNGICKVENGTALCYCRHPFYGKTCDQEYNPTTDPSTFVSTTDLDIQSTHNMSWDTTLGRTTISPSNFTNDSEWTSNHPSNFTNYHNLTTAEQWNITVGTTYEPSNFTTEVKWTTNQPSNFTNDHNLTTAEQWNITVWSTIEPSNFTNDIKWTTNQPSNFTNFHNLTTAEQWNITVGTTIDPSKNIFTSDSNVTSVSNQTAPWNITEEYRTTTESSNYTQYHTSEKPQNFTEKYTETSDFKNLKTGRPIDTTLTDTTSTTVPPITVPSSTVPTSKPGAEIIFRNVYTIRNLTEIIIKS